jgi:diaminopimelate epimerase
MELRFKKMHGLGNCFVLFDDRDGELGAAVDPARLARAVCDRNFGIGADGILLVQSATDADFRMQIINEDGSEAEMCGNGIRCFARHLVDEGITERRELAIDTGAGVMHTRVLEQGLVEVDMGQPELASADVVADGEAPLRVEEAGRRFTFVSMGNPHVIAFVEDYDFDWRAEGARVEQGRAFPNRTNVEYVRVVSPTEAEMKVWERGCGETMACGTGACAVAVAGALEQRLAREPVTIHLPGGDLRIHWNDRDRVIMTGPTVEVCRGVYHYDR